MRYTGEDALIASERANRVSRLRGSIEQHRVLSRALVIALIVVAIFILGWQGGEDYVTNIYTELVGVIISAGVTVVIVDRAYERQSRIRLQRDLVQEAGSRSNDIVIYAIERLRKHGWLSGPSGLLKGADLRNANLQRADMRLESPAYGLESLLIRTYGAKTVAQQYGTNLEGAQLFRANLQQANLFCASLQEAIMNQANLTLASALGANLESAQLAGAVLIGADLSWANLTNADLRQTNLQCADLHRANLTGAVLQPFTPQRPNGSEDALNDKPNAPETAYNEDFDEFMEMSLEAGPDAPRDASRYGADLRGADLRGADLTGSKLESVFLPDGTLYSSNMDTDRLRAFTDTDHTDFQPTLNRINQYRRENGFTEIRVVERFS